jgi:N-hydroxyarylamine O-acetyltransferase
MVELYNLPYSPNLPAFLKFIDYTGSSDVTLENLRCIQENYVMSITFENFDIHLPLKGKVDIRPSLIEKKILFDKRGGYCWEQNTLLFYMLSAFGFKVRRVGCQVRYRLTAAPVGTTHMALLIDIDNKDWLVDVAFGGMTATYPLDIDNLEEISSAYDPLRRIRTENDILFHEANLNDVWHSLYSFSTDSFEHSDAVICNLNTYSNPQSQNECATSLMISKITRDARYTFFNNELKIWKHDRKLEENEAYTISSPIELLSIIEKYFNIILPFGTILGPSDSPWPKSKA